VRVDIPLDRSAFPLFLWRLLEILLMEKYMTRKMAMVALTSLFLFASNAVNARSAVGHYYKPSKKACTQKQKQTSRNDRDNQNVPAPVSK
jgi:hypothetical protein